MRAVCTRESGSSANSCDCDQRRRSVLVELRRGARFCARRWAGPGIPEAGTLCLSESRPLASCVTAILLMRQHEHSGEMLSRQQLPGRPRTDPCFLACRVGVRPVAAHWGAKRGSGTFPLRRHPCGRGRPAGSGCDRVPQFGLGGLRRDAVLNGNQGCGQGDLPSGVAYPRHRGRERAGPVPGGGRDGVAGGGDGRPGKRPAALVDGSRAGPRFVGPTSGPVGPVPVRAGACCADSRGPGAPSGRRLR